MARFVNDHCRFSHATWCPTAAQHTIRPLPRSSKPTARLFIGRTYSWHTANRRRRPPLPFQTASSPQNGGEQRLGGSGGGFSNRQFTVRLKDFPSRKHTSLMGAYLMPAASRPRLLARKASNAVYERVGGQHHPPRFSFACLAAHGWRPLRTAILELPAWQHGGRANESIPIIDAAMRCLHKNKQPPPPWGSRRGFFCHVLNLPAAKGEMWILPVTDRFRCGVQPKALLVACRLTALPARTLPPPSYVTDRTVLLSNGTFPNSPTCPPGTPSDTPCRFACSVDTHGYPVYPVVPHYS